MNKGKNGFPLWGNPFYYFRRDFEKGETVRRRRRLPLVQAVRRYPNKCPWTKPCPGAGLHNQIGPGVREGPVHQLQHPLAGDPGALGVHGDHPVGEQVEAISLFGPLGKPIPGEVQG